ncbi:acetyltransferase [Belliella sp. DSM 111904]|uniref:Acetyltransferase n=1 Tax=Belliella filtrata TaxID=2923435 RepID=A0ABS9V2Y2_9BACT|nr:acetyltransferase [Belliella filtrata]MCH7410350.1 acetyltransferase [Belliella filtrata]
MGLVNIIGASGHAKAIIDLFPNKEHIAGIFDDDLQLEYVMGMRVTTPIPSTLPNEYPIIIAIGSNQGRYKFANERFKNAQFTTVIHESALVSKSVSLGMGTIVMERVVVKVDSSIGDHVILNTLASIDHDCKIEDFTHIAPGCTLCGNVQVGQGTLVGAKSVILPNVKIGRWCVIGAGSVVHQDLEDGSRWIGNRKV